MNFDISTLCCNFLFIINSQIKFVFKKCKTHHKKQDVPKPMPPCHVLIIIATEFIKNTKKSRMFLRTGLLELWILFIRLFNVILRGKEKYLPQITLKEVTIFATNSWKLTAIRDLWWLNLRPVTVQNATLYFHLLSWHFFFFF